ncbi:HD domain-containing protein [Paucibacter sp. PLA-PC-4]|uniref:HD domain-containing phosphohydrolase n=1 Tax=Paucibacter sp. PLA-PC-4 TaxID=2993655 RepID=UPI002248DA46|nr:HD domain-containing phosphohydrolase [Paucibacter sp. PLA-PC-4]MCX2860922.1 HD domain-containing protein [Paucibacter sp. PLA-PC-4]
MKLLSLQPRSIYLTLSIIMIGMVLLLYAALASYQLRAGEQRMLAFAADTSARVGRETLAVIDGELRPARTTAALLARSGLLSAPDHSGRLAQLPLLAAALQQNPSLSAVYGGTPNGSFVLLRRIAGAELHALLRAPEQAAFVLQSVNRDGATAQGTYLFYDAGLVLLERREQADYDFDPRRRPWFAQAQNPDRAVQQTLPYLFFTTREVGLTLASGGGFGGASVRAVAGVDVSLASLSAMLARQQITPSAELMVVDAQGSVLAYPRPERLSVRSQDGSPKLLQVEQLGVPVLTALWQRLHGGGAWAGGLLELDGREWVTRIEALEQGAGAPLTLLIAAPRDELQADAIQARRLSVLITAGIVLLMLPLVHWSANLVAKPLQQLAREAEAIRRFDFSGPDPGRSRIREVDRLAIAMTGMKQALRRFLEISSALSAERNFDRLLERILTETISVAEATGGAVHLLSADGLRLEPAAARVFDSPGDSAALMPWALDDAASPSAAVQAVRQGRTVFVDISWDNPAHMQVYAGLFQRLNSSRFRLMALPLKNRQGETVGALSLSFVPGEDRDTLSPSRVAFIEALSGTAAAALDNQQLLRARKELLESFIRLVAGAIDAKSPYTGAHCQRVPELTKMLARAACEASDGPFADFRLDEEQWEALHIAAWLHDCGKVTTPEFVVDKATKLETLHDRIHEIRTRFEVLKRDAQIALCERALTPEQLARVRQDLAPVHALLDAEFVFVAACNEGGEYLSPDKQARLREIGARSWWRTLDDRLGVSNGERQRQSATPAAELPVQERLLADKPEHVLPRPAAEHMPELNRWGFKIRQPEHLYNRGELHNLSISRGTLTEEERYKVNEHIVQSIRMLEALPFPRHLRRVPEIAGGHHEKMDGSGYPRGLRREQMSIEARMMAIADVFEALTADDRPYKKGKSLSQALDIMARMRREEHIDAELFELFLRSGVYLDYARRFMHPEQIDAVDLAAALA